MLMRRFALLVAILVTLPAGIRAQYTRAAADRPQLVVFLTVDQLRPDYLDKWAAQLTGGLGRLSKRGAFFTNAMHDHAVTETAPGHSVVMSGRYPRSTGIVSNTLGVLDPQSPLLTSSDAPASPYRFRGSALIDWIRTRDTRARALSISRKDRGAILPLGKAKQSVFWYATSNGEFTTSRYYADTLPTWVKGVNARRTPQRLAGRSWTLMLPASEYAEPDDVVQENTGRDVTFPHVMPADSTRAAGEMVWTPWLDELTLDAALAGLEALQLGRGEQTDILAVSLSGTDYVGHRYGPDSRELHDNVLRLDRALGVFIDSLYRLRDSSSIVFALTGDHGVTPYPELVAARAKRVAPPRYNLVSVLAAFRSTLRTAGVDSGAVTVDGGIVSVNRQAFAQSAVDPEPMLRRFAEAVRRSPGIARVDRVRDLAQRDTLRDAVARRWLHMIPPDSPAEFVVTPREGTYAAQAMIAEHGQPYDADARVPVIFYGPWFRTARFSERAFVVDMAPTLAKIIGVPPIERLDGKVLNQAIAPTARR